jgi:hypothetical protein
MVTFKAGGEEKPEREEVVEPLKEPTPERRKESVPEEEPEKVPAQEVASNGTRDLVCHARAHGIRVKLPPSRRCPS